jgi:hypothetical protein
LDVEPEVVSREDQKQEINTKKTRNSLAVGLCAVGLFTGMLSVAQADTIAFSPTLSLNGAGVGNDGFFFTPTTAISVTELGYVDCGFSVGHDVGLYDVSTSTLLASATITGSSTLDSGFYYNLIAPVSLTAGNEYAVVGTQVEADHNWTVDSLVVAPEITFDGYFYDHNTTLDIPTIPYDTAYFGPNFQYAIVPAPEPTTMTVMIAGALLLLPFKAGAPRMLRQNRMP